MIIRKATINDINDIAKIIVKGWQNTYENLLPDDFLKELSVSKREEMLTNIIKDNNITLLVAESDGIVGQIGFGECSTEKKTGQIYSLYVKTENKNQGVGTSLINTALNTLQKQYSKVVVNVLVGNNNALKFYLNKNFKDSGKIKTSSWDNITFSEHSLTHYFNNK